MSEPTRDRLSVCVCYSGEMRAFEGNFAWSDSCADWLEVDSVVATWAARGGKMSGHLSQARMRSVFPDQIYDAFPPSWVGGSMHVAMPGLRGRVMRRAESDRITEAQIRAELPNAAIHIEERLNFRWFERPTPGNDRLRGMDPFSMQMLYKIWQADLMRKNLENARGRPYDLVIRARPDRPIGGLDQELLRSIRPGQIYLNYANHERRSAGDFFAIGDSATMDIYGQYFFDAYRAAMAGQWHVIHSDMFDYLLAKDIDLRSYDPMHEFAPESMILLDDILEEIAAQPGAGVAASGLFQARDGQDIAILGQTLRLAQSLSRGTVGPGDEPVVAHLDRVLAAFDPARDCGLFFYLVIDCEPAEGRAGLDFPTRLMAAMLGCCGVSNINNPDYDLFRAGLARNLSALTAARYPLPGDPAKLLDTCLACVDAGDRPSPMGQRLRTFLGTPAARAMVIAALARTVPPLAPMLTGHIIASAAKVSGGGDVPRAEQMLRSVLEHQPDNSVAHVHLALCLESLRRPEEATLTALRGVRENSAGAPLMHLATLMLRRLRNLTAAETVARRLFELPNCPPQYLFHLIDILAETDRPDEARDAARRASEQHPDNQALRTRLEQLGQG